MCLLKIYQFILIFHFRHFIRFLFLYSEHMFVFWYEQRKEELRIRLDLVSAIQLPAEGREKCSCSEKAKRRVSLGNRTNATRSGLADSIPADKRQLN
jgi:hypothetical protein